MKRVLFVILSALLGLSVYSQDYKYYDLKSIGNDTTAYLYKNFVEQKSFLLINHFLKSFVIMRRILESEQWA